MKKKVLIIGGAGFFGFHLSKKLLENKYKVDIIDNFSKKSLRDKDFTKLLKNKNCKLFKQDFTKKVNIKLFKKNYSHIFNFAAILGVNKVINSPYKVLLNNILIHSNFLKLLNVNKNAHLFYTSTSEVYAGSLKRNLLKFPTKESNILVLDDLNNKRSVYMLSKIYCESMCHHFVKKVTILRPHNIYGPRMGNVHVIPQLIEKLLKKNFSEKAYSPNHKRTFCYIDDFINYIYILMNSKNIKKFSTFNVGNPYEEITIKKLLEKIKKILKVNKKFEWVKDNHSSPTRRIPSINKIIKITKYKPQNDLNIGIQKTIRWYLQN